MNIQKVVSVLLIALSYNSALCVSIRELLQENALPKIERIEYFISDKYKTIHSLDLSKLNITDLDGLLAIPYIQEVERLVLSENKITQLTHASIGKLERLRILALTANRIKTVEENTFADLPELEELYLNINKLETLAPKIFNKNAKLRILSLTFNKLTTLQAKTLNTCKNLEELWLSNNQITLITPQIIPNLQKLRVLDLEHNGIKNLTNESLPQLPSLETLWLRGNQLSDTNKTSIKSYFKLIHVYI